MFSKHLFTHKYDIDTLIAALCGPHPQWLNTETGALSATEPAAPPTHRFKVEPLPSSFLAELAANAETRHLSETEQTELAALLASLTSPAQLPPHFEEGRPGGWLREQVKDAALEWLDSHDLIPPSMRHINRQKAAKLYASRTVTIIED